MPDSLPTKVGFIGLGAMGKWMATHLADKLPGNAQLFVYDVVEALVDELVASYANRITKCKNAAEVAESSVGPLPLSMYRC